MKKNIQIIIIISKMSYKSKWLIYLMRVEVASVKSVVGCSACTEHGWGVLVCTKTVWWLQREAF